MNAFVHNSDVSTNNSDWSLVEFVTAPSDVELVSDLLWALGVVAIEELAEDDNSVILRTSVGESPVAAIEEVLQRFPEVTTRSVQISRSVADTWRVHATPTWVDNTIVLVPAWLTAPENSSSIFIEPADTFGLGNHPTTVLALRLALQHTSQDSTVFDLGCGSGVLGISLAKFRDCQVDVNDIAMNAQHVVQKNCEINEVTTVSWSQWPSTRKYDVALANILAPVLIAEASAITSALAVSGLLVLSGMRDEQVSAVLDHYPLFEEISRDSQDGWTAVALTAPRS